MQGPTQFIHDDPRENTPVFGGVAVDMRRLSVEGGFDYSYLSKIFAGQLPRPAFGKRLAEALGMTLPDLYAACEAAQVARRR